MSEQDNSAAEAIITDDTQDIELDLEDIAEENVETKTYSEDQFKQVLARAKKAEAELKAKKQSTTATTQTINNTPSNTSEDISVQILKAQGTPQDEIEVLKKISKLNNVDVIDAREDNLYKLYKTQKEATEKAEKAKLGASKGSGSVKKEKGINSPGLTQEEHKALWREKNGLN